MILISEDGDIFSFSTSQHLVQGFELARARYPPRIVSTDNLILLATVGICKVAYFHWLGSYDPILLRHSNYFKSWILQPKTLSQLLGSSSRKPSNVPIHTYRRKRAIFSHSMTTTVGNHVLCTTGGTSRYNHRERELIIIEEGSKATRSPLLPIYMVVEGLDSDPRWNICPVSGKVLTARNEGFTITHYAQALPNSDSKFNHQ